MDEQEHRRYRMQLDHLRRLLDRAEARARAEYVRGFREGVAEQERRLRPELDALEARLTRMAGEFALIREQLATEPTRVIDRSGNGG